jgi:TIR domain
VWWDRRILPGQTWDEVIAEVLAAAHCVVVVWTKASVDSDWVRIEANFGRERQILVPVLLEAIEVPLAFRLIQAASLAGWDGVNGHPGLTQLEDGVQAVLARARPGVVVPTDLTEERAIDAAVARDIPVLEATNLITMIRGAGSEGLKAILENDEEYGLSPSDVASKPFELAFPADAAGRPLPAQLLLRVSAPDFDPPNQEKLVRVPPLRDSAVFGFLLKPVIAGPLLIQLEVYHTGDCIASRLLRPNGVPSGRIVGPAPHVVVSLPLRATIGPPSATTSISAPPGDPPAAAAAKVVVMPDVVGVSPPREEPDNVVVGPRKPSRLPPAVTRSSSWKAATIAVLALVIIAPAIYWGLARPSSRPENQVTVSIRPEPSEPSGKVADSERALRQGEARIQARQKGPLEIFVFTDPAGIVAWRSDAPETACTTPCRIAMKASEEDLILRYDNKVISGAVRRIDGKLVFRPALPLPPEIRAVLIFP